MNAALPRLRRITGEYSVSGDVKIRPADLYVSTGYRQPGIVLVGDAFATTCPVSGTGTDKVLTDVTQLCNVHIPAWLATEGMSEAKIASFYVDPVKQACDAWSSAKAFSFRKVTMDRGVYWKAQRWARFLGWLGKGAARRIRNRVSAERPRSLLLVVILVIIVFIVVVGLTGRIVRLVALVVPELAVGAIGIEQLRVRAALDRLAV